VTITVPFESVDVPASA